MAVTYGFYNALNHDRLYDAIQMSSIFDGIIRDGIFSTIGTSMVVTAPEDGLYVNVGPGRAWFNHTWTLNDTEYPVEAEEAEVVLDRIDAVILEVNSAAEVRANRIYFLKGTPASEPVKPTLTHNAEVNQYALAYVRIRAGQSTIFQADVENVVGTEETPFVTGLMQQVSIENLILQWEAEFDDHFENWRNVNEAEFEVWSSDMQDEYNRWILNQVNTYQTWFAGIQAEAGDDIDEVMAWFEHMKGQVSEDAAIHLQEEIDALALSAEKGSVVTIHTINQTLYGKNCVISQDGQSRTARFDNTGTAVFESIPYVGQVTVTATDGTLTAVTYLTIPYFGRYSTNLAFWAATVNISTESPEFFSLPIKIFKNNVLIETISFSALGSATYIATSEGTYKFSVTYDEADFDHTIEIDEETTYTVVINDWNATLNMQTSVSELYGRGITISKGGVTVGTTTFNGSGRATYKVHEPGTYHIVTSTAGGDTYSADVVVTEETAYPVDLGLPNGRTVLPTDDIQTWLHCAGINDKGYTTLAEVLEDSVTFNALLSDSNACDYMARSATFGKAEGLVPTMTSDNEPSGEVIYNAQSTADNCAGYKAFDESSDRGWWAISSSPGIRVDDYIGYTFDTATRVIMAKITFLYSSSASTIKGKIQGYNGTNWVNVTEEITITSNSSNKPVYAIFTENINAYAEYRFICTVAPTSWSGYGIKLQFYSDADITTSQFAMSLLGRYDYACEALLANADWAEAIANSEYFESVLDKKVPKMTSYTTPSGEVIYQGSVYGSYYPWKAFDQDGSTSGLVAAGTNNYIGYDFVDPVVVNKAYFFTNFSSLSATGVVQVIASNDKTNWDVLVDDIAVAQTSGYTPTFANDNAYRYYAIRSKSQTSGTTYGFSLLQLYGRHSSQNLVPLVPTMTSDTAPSGVCSASVESQSTTPAYYAFDGGSNTWALYTQGGVGSWLRYDFPVGTTHKVSTAIITGGANQNIGTDPVKFKIQASNDGTDWTDISDEVSWYLSESGTTKTIPLDPNDTAYNKFRVYFTTNMGYDGSHFFGLSKVQLYKEYEAGVIHSVPNDTVYYLENGVETTLCTCDSNGVGEVDWSELPQGVMTLYSTTAKDPNNLSNDFSMNIRVTPNKVDAFLIPDNALYWWGWKSQDLEDGTSANGWSSNVIINGTPSYATNSVTVNVCGIGTKSMKTGLTTAKVLVSSCSGTYTNLAPHADAKYMSSADSGTRITTTGLQTLDLSNVTGNYYLYCFAYSGSSLTLSAFIFE